MHLDDSFYAAYNAHEKIEVTQKVNHEITRGVNVGNMHF